MQYKIPRYIDYRAKIFGPANMTQFIILLVGGFLIGFVWLLTDSFLSFVPIALLIAGASGGLAFGRINGKPVPEMLMRYLQFKLKGRQVYFWKKDKKVKQAMIKEVKEKDDDDDEMNTDNLTKRKGRLDEISKKIETS